MTAGMKSNNVRKNTVVSSILALSLTLGCGLNHPVIADADSAADSGDESSTTAEAGLGNSTEAGAIIESATHMKSAIVGPLKAKIETAALSGVVTKNQSPFLEGHIQTVPKDTKVDITLVQNINSEFSQKGDEIWARVSCDVPGGADGRGPIMPGGWMAHGVITEAQGEKRGNRSGFVAIEFDKIVSPDGQYEVDFKGKLTTKDGAPIMIAKQALTSSRFMGTGALGGALLSMQVTGIGGAIASHGISVGIGAGIGATLGVIGFLNHKGGADSHYSNDDMKITIDQPIELPVFAASAFRAAKPVPHLKNMKIAVNSFKFAKDPYGDKQSNLLEVAMTIENHTDMPVSARQISIVNDFDKQFMPMPNASLRALMNKVQPNTSERITVVYEVDSAKHKYWLSLHDAHGGTELSRVPIN